MPGRSGRRRADARRERPTPRPRACSARGRSATVLVPATVARYGQAPAVPPRPAARVGAEDARRTTRRPVAPAAGTRTRRAESTRRAGWHRRGGQRDRDRWSGGVHRNAADPRPESRALVTRLRGPLTRPDPTTRPAPWEGGRGVVVAQAGGPGDRTSIGGLLRPHDRPHRRSAGALTIAPVRRKRVEPGRELPPVTAYAAAAAPARPIGPATAPIRPGRRVSVDRCCRRAVDRRAAQTGEAVWRAASPPDRRRPDHAGTGPCPAGASSTVTPARPAAGAAGPAAASATGRPRRCSGNLLGLPGGWRAAAAGRDTERTGRSTTGPTAPALTRRCPAGEGQAVPRYRSPRGHPPARVRPSRRVRARPPGRAPAHGRRYRDRWIPAPAGRPIPRAAAPARHRTSSDRPRSTPARTSWCGGATRRLQLAGRRQPSPSRKADLAGQAAGRRRPLGLRVRRRRVAVLRPPCAPRSPPLRLPCADSGDKLQRLGNSPAR